MRSEGDAIKLIRMLGSVSTPRSDLSLTVPEAAFVTGHSVRSVNHEIDAGIIAARDRPARAIHHPDLIYLGAVRDIRTDLGLDLRQRLHEAITAALGDRRCAAQVGHLRVALDAVEDEVSGKLRVLHRLRAQEIEQRADILAGEPVLAGTRIPARHVADMIRRGTSTTDVANEFDLTPAQMAAAMLFDRVSPRQGRPPRKARALVSAA